MTLLERAREKFTTDYAIAKAAGVTPQYMYKVRDGERPLSPDVAANLAEAMGEDPNRAALEALAAQAKTDADRKKWKKRIASYVTSARIVESRPVVDGSLAQSVEQLAFN